ncbi:MAG: FKBP-type peptidyl-prolyl cis-trans isomerase [Bacteroidota bacterium]
MIKWIMGLAVVAILATGCEKDQFITTEEQIEIDAALIDDYLMNNGIDAQESPSRIRYVIETPGTGATPTANQQVTIRYEQYLLDGTYINGTDADSSVTFNISTALLGVQQSLVLLKEGGKGTFIIPSYLSFGTNSSDVIPANAIFRFEIELLEVVTEAKQLAKDVELITDYLADNEVQDIDSTASGIYYFFEDETEGDKPTANSTVTVRYRGYFLNGDTFDETQGEATATFSLNGVIPGWKEALQLFPKGSRGTFLLPSVMAYGPSGNGTIPPNTVLAFDVELVDFE